MYKAFVSSTYLDLKDHRAHVIRALRKAGFSVDPMEDWTSDADEPKMLSQERVVGCDLCILLVAFRRGYVPEGETESVTQLEYRTARTHGIDVLPFVLDAEAAWPRRFDESARDPLLELWRVQLKKDHVISFFGHDPQSVEVAPALSRWLAGRSAPQTAQGGELPFVPWLGRPDSLRAGFFGRDDELKTIAGAFERHRIVVISGGAGMGKSRLVAEYAHESKKSGFWSTWAGDIPQLLATLAPSLNIPTEGRADDQIAQAVKVRLAQLSADILWVIDNIGDLNSVNQLANEIPKVKLLVTTRDDRDHMVPKAIHCVLLQPLEDDPSIALLCSRWRHTPAPNPRDPNLKRLVEAVGRLPLALEMLAVRIGASPLSLAVLAEELERAGSAVGLQAFREAAGTTIDCPEGVFAVIAGTLNRLPPKVREQIALLAYTADAPIPLPLVAALTGCDGMGLNNMLEVSRQHGVLRFSGNDVVIHALTAAALEAMDAGNSIKRNINLAYDRIKDISERGAMVLRNEMPHYQVLFARAERYIGLENRLVLNLATEVGIAFRTIGRYHAALDLDQRIVATEKILSGLRNPYTFNAQTNLAIDYWLAGNHLEALCLDAEILAGRLLVLGPLHRDTLTSLNNLAVDYANFGRYEEEIRLQQVTLQLRQQELGLLHRETLTSRGNLGASYHRQGSYQKALQLNEETLGLMEQALGPDDPITLIVLENLGNNLWLLDRKAEAVNTWERTFAARQRVLGISNPYTRKVRNVLIQVYRAAGRTADAERLEREEASLDTPQEGA